MRRQATTLLVSAIFALALAIGATRLPVPYVRDVPGPVSNTLGSAQGKPIVAIAHPTATPQGRIYLVTVSEFGGPRKSISSFDVLEGWWKKSDAVIPRRMIYSDTQTPQQVNQEGAAEMISSQEEAKVAALRYLGSHLTPMVKTS
jgi:Lon-like protease